MDALDGLLIDEYMDAIRDRYVNAVANGDREWQRAERLQRDLTAAESRWDALRGWLREEVNQLAVERGVSSIGHRALCKVLAKMAELEGDK